MSIQNDTGPDGATQYASEQAHLLMVAAATGAATLDEAIAVLDKDQTQYEEALGRASEICTRTWCTLGDQHPFDSVSPAGSPCRWHTRSCMPTVAADGEARQYGVDVVLAQEELVTSEGSTFNAPVVEIVGDTSLSTAEDVTAVMVGLLRAMERFGQAGGQ